MKLSYKFSFFISSNFEYVIVDALVNVDNGLGHKLLRYIYTELLKRKENYLGFLIPKNMWKIQ